MPVPVEVERASLCDVPVVSFGATLQPQARTTARGRMLRAKEERSMQAPAAM
jgi:hypothetical protein